MYLLGMNPFKQPKHALELKSSNMKSKLQEFHLPAASLPDHNNQPTA